ncbi:hypothetical protein FO519_006230 [Halicephalobus sp. NKZ332]|nr:hypothetical protein FO519_006230 [Halicephalobus sp. NKZ332]
MKALRAAARLGFLRRQAPRVDLYRAAHDAHDSHGHHEDHNPGPPVTFDYSPVPFQSYQVVYNDLQRKFNMYLGVSVALFLVSVGLAVADDVFIIEALPAGFR